MATKLNDDFLQDSARHTAHIRKTDGAKQDLQDHLFGVARRARHFAHKIGLADSGELLGLLHDIGKYGTLFQNYLKSAEGNIDPDADEYVDAESLRGKIDHSTAGAQYVWESLDGQGKQAGFVAELLAICVVSHHSGLIDCLEPDGTNRLNVRLRKDKAKTHETEVLAALDPAIKSRIETMVRSDRIVGDVVDAAYRIGKAERYDSLRQFQFGMLARFLFSCLLDADRLDSADFEKPAEATMRLGGLHVQWNKLIDRLERRLAEFSLETRVDKIRKDVSEACRLEAKRERGIYRLTVPTGGGKTLSSLRFALYHARKHGLERIIYVVPFTTIIDQNAGEIRNIMEDERYGPELKGRVVLEHHSNLAPGRDTWQNKLLSENWDAPIVFTTSVQILEAMFGAGTQGARRLHQLAKAVIIFDEAQTIPARCVHLFNNALNFLVEQTGSSAVLCTATQPLLDRVDERYGVLRVSRLQPEIIPDVDRLFHELNRTEVVDRRRHGGWAVSDIVGLVASELERSGSVLVVVNTKAAARALYTALENDLSCGVERFHLSTSMCPAHRLKSLRRIRWRLKKHRPIVCVSTQLIEAGVDVDFGSAIRFTAGLDSIAQTAGRCNRNGLQPNPGQVSIINPIEEDLGSLEEIAIGKDKTERVLREYADDPQSFAHDIVGPRAIERYYQYYFFQRKSEMTYKVGPRSVVGRADTLLRLLSGNETSAGEYMRSHQDEDPPNHFRQAFMSAAKAFQSIDAPTQGVIVPYCREGKNIIGGLFASEAPESEFCLLHRAQRYSVNVFANLMQRLKDRGGALPIGGSGLVAIDERFYSEQFGLTDEPETLVPAQIV